MANESSAETGIDPAEAKILEYEVMYIRNTFPVSALADRIRSFAPSKNIAELKSVSHDARFSFSRDAESPTDLVYRAIKSGTDKVVRLLEMQQIESGEDNGTN